MVCSPLSVPGIVGLCALLKTSYASANMDVELHRGHRCAAGVHDSRKSFVMVPSFATTNNQGEPALPLKIVL